MAYVPTEWKSGDIVTASKLNNIENGLKAMNVLIVKVTESNNVREMNRTYKQIADAFKKGQPVRVLDETAGTYADVIEINETTFSVRVQDGVGIYVFSASSNTAHPTRNTES